VISRAGRLLSTIDRARDGLALDAGLYLLSAAFALVTGLSSTLLAHRAWGLIAVWTYLGALVVVTVQLGARRPAARMPLTWAAWAGTALLPLVVEAVQRAGGRTDRAQDEVLVVEQMGERLLHTGTPYLGPDTIAALPLPDRLGAYAPYQPGMAVFGLPRALGGDAWWTDARVFFAVVTLAALVTAVRALGSGPSSVRALQAATVFPICALTLATGGDDIPVMALCLLALAWCATDRYGLAGLAVGAAAACKLFAFPVVAVLAVLALVSGRGRRFLPGAIGLPIIVLIPPFLVDGNAFVENVIRFPLGRGLVQSPAQSPFPGHLISSGLPGGRYIAAGLLVAVAVAIAVGLIRRPPRTAATAALFCGYGLLAAILLMPTTRFGYLLYPVALLAWAPALSKPTAAAAPRGDAALYRV
jgi:Glycosyltransferase family 87